MSREPENVHPGAQSPEPNAEAPDFGLPRSRRMWPALYRDAFARERSIPGRFLVLWLRAAPDADRRLGVVTSRRTLPSAVSRNRARRLLREAFRMNRACLLPGFDVLLLARGRIEKAKRQDVEEDLRTTCRRAGIWRNGPC